jgi:integrase
MVARRWSSKRDALTHAEFESLWEAALHGTEYDRLIFVLAAQLGLRASEIGAVRRSWIDFQRQILRIPLEDEGWKAKTKAAARAIPYGRMRRAPQVIASFFDFHDRVGLSRYAVWGRVKRLAKRAGLTRPIYPHALRATAAYQLAEAGLSAQALRQIMGWSDLRTAQAYIDAAGIAAQIELEEKGTKLW